MEMSGLKFKTLNFARHVSIYFFIYLFLHNLCVLNTNQSDNFFYLASFTFKFDKQKMAAKTTYLLLFPDK